MHYSGEKQCFVLACNNSKRTTAVSLSEGIGFQIWPLKKTSVQFESWLVSKIFEEISIF